MPESGFYWMGPKEGGVVVLCRFPSLAAAKAHFAAVEDRPKAAAEIGDARSREKTGDSVPEQRPSDDPLPVPVPAAPRPPAPAAPVVRTGVAVFTDAEDLEILTASLRGEAALAALASDWGLTLRDLHRRLDQVNKTVAREMEKQP